MELITTQPPGRRVKPGEQGPRDSAASHALSNPSGPSSLLRDPPSHQLHKTRSVVPVLTAKERHAHHEEASQQQRQDLPPRQARGSGPEGPLSSCSSRRPGAGLWWQCRGLLGTVKAVADRGPAQHTCAAGPGGDSQPAGSCVASAGQAAGAWDWQGQAGG